MWPEARAAAGRPLRPSRLRSGRCWSPSLLWPPSVHTSWYPRHLRHDADWCHVLLVHCIMDQLRHRANAAVPRSPPRYLWPLKGDGVLANPQRYARRGLAALRVDVRGGVRTATQLDGVIRRRHQISLKRLDTSWLDAILYISTSIPANQSHLMVSCSAIARVDHDKCGSTSPMDISLDILVRYFRVTYGMVSYGL